MFNFHELLVLLISQTTQLFLVQNIFPIFLTYEHANITPSVQIYNFQNDFFSASDEWISHDEFFHSYIWDQVNPSEQFGIFIGSVTFGFLTDKFGRRRLCRYGFFAAGTILWFESLLFYPTFVVFLRFLIGILVGGILVSSWSMITELISNRARLIARSFATFANARLIYVLICLISRNWRISLQVSAVLAFFCAALHFLIPESPTWLQLHGKHDEAVKICERISKKSNGQCEIVLPKDACESLSFYEIWKIERYRHLIYLFSFLWIVTNFTAVFIDFSVVVIIPGNFMTSQILLALTPATVKTIYGCLELLGYVKISRRTLHLSSLTIITVSMSISAGLIITNLHEKSPYNVVYIVVFLIGTSCLEFVWDACYLGVVEQVPTEIRGTITGVCSFVARIAGICASYMIFIKSSWAPSPCIIVFAISVIHFLVAFKFLKDTSNVNLAEVGRDMRRLSTINSVKIGGPRSSAFP